MHLLLRFLPIRQVASLRDAGKSAQILIANNRRSFFVAVLLLFLSSSPGETASQVPKEGGDGRTVTLERMAVASGNVTMDINVDRLRGVRSEAQDAKPDQFRFGVNANYFFAVRVLNDVLRGPEPGSMGLTWNNSRALPEPLNASSNQLVVEKVAPTEPFDLVVRDGKTGFTFFNIEGNLYDYDAIGQLLSIHNGRLLISEELANKLGRSKEAGTVVGEISIKVSVYPIEITTFVNGAVKSSIMPPRRARDPQGPDGAGVPGPDIIVGSMQGLQQFGSAPGQVGLGIGTTSCNNGDQPVHFYELPNTDHSVVTQNLYRMSGGTTNDDRFEQIGGAWVKHTFGASQDDECSFGCDPFPDFTELGVGCSDTYASSQNASQTDHVGALGSRAWVNPFTGAFPSNPRPESHAGHVHTGTSHRILVNISDLDLGLNVGATYYAEVQYDSPHEYAWCQTHPGQCNMYNNASYRRYNVSGTTSFSFAAVGSTVRMTPATGAWTGATSSTVEPAPGVDGRAFVVYKVTNPSPGVWHYEYAVHNQNLDRSIQSFSVPLGCGAAVSNIGFHAPPNHPGFSNDGTVGNTGFSNTPWVSTQTFNDLSWTTETIAQNPNANAIRFGTLYNFRFDSDHPPQAAMATVGFFKTGSPITVPIQAPLPDVCASTPTPATTVTISGFIFYCADPAADPVPQVTLEITGTTAGSTVSDSSGNYQFQSLVAGGTYTIAPSKESLVPASPGIGTVDVVATQQHFLNIAPLPPGCALTAADVNGDSSVNTVDTIAIQRFFLGFTAGIGNVGKFQFSPANRSYQNITSNQSGQNFDALVFGDVVFPFAERAVSLVPEKVNNK